MSLIKCPECDKQISDRSYSCPHCGYPLRENASTAQTGSMGETAAPEEPAIRQDVNAAIEPLPAKNSSVTEEQSVTKRTNKRTLIALSGIVVLAGILLSVFFLKKPSPKPEDPIVGSWILIGYQEGDNDTDSLVPAEEGQCSVVFNSSGSGLVSLDNKGETTELTWEVEDTSDPDCIWYIIHLGEDQTILAASLTFTEGDASNLLTIGTGEIMMLFGQPKS